MLGFPSSLGSGVGGRGQSYAKFLASTVGSL